MTTLEPPVAEAVGAVSVRFAGDLLYIVLNDGREIGLSLKWQWLDWLRRATPAQRQRWSLEPDGFAVYWEELDDGIEITHLLSSWAIA
ncbi:MAG: DUF2442 domain-containing protein [Chloroflexi bacterium]|nr:DUF2442 domain-containing protein [Chloroflexota bacterium]